MVTAVLLFILGLVLLIFGGDKFVDGAVGIAKRFHVPEILIGATIVSIGTTLPEVLVSATSAFKGSGDIAYGNAVGSVICNTALISALTIAIKPGKVDRKTMIVPSVFFFSSAVIYMIFAYFFGGFGRIAGGILLAIFIAYMIINVLNVKKLPQPEISENAEPVKHEKRDTFKNIAHLIAGAVCIAVGSDLLVDNGMFIAKEIGVPESVIGLTFVALGTSLPELVTAITSLIKGHGSLSLGNIIGANLFDLVLVSGLAPLISPFKIPQGNTLFGINATLVLELPVMLLVMGILCIPPLIRGKLSRAQGIILMLIYAGFCAIQFIM